VPPSPPLAGAAFNNGMGSAQSTERRRQNENESRATTRLLNQVN